MIVEGELRELEERLIAPGPAESRESLAQLLSAQYREFGAAGKVQGGGEMIEALLGNARPRTAIEDFATTSVSPGVVLVTYKLKCLPGAGWKPAALRSSLWCWRDGRWQLLFHQGTVVPAN